ncbi:hypothetical protein VN12_05640 [Pirellula sp. SH-Sr6A]|uniref:hypothetical protein n=1 Tax=Pirellula sp. SH-Sr6A TaxID=1632865 RepID=UPI00078E6084|nr:hypothetical protein [Pirellula sp. SH-Sr6A]AMV31581.1 hypothetical protein VN12_05640 [Pirellula sp. SH-Sr6A]
MSSQSWFVEGLRKLAGSIKEIEYYQTGSEYAIWQAMNQAGNPLAAKDHPDVKAWRQFKEDIVVELNAVVKIGLQQYGADLACCRKLSVELSQGFYKDGSSTTFDAIVEVVALADKLEFCSTSRENEAGGSCDNFNDNITQVRNDIDAKVAAIVNRVMRRKLSQTEKGKAIADQVTESDWTAFATAHGTTQDPVSYFTKLVQDIDRERPPKWLKSKK